MRGLAAIRQVFAIRNYRYFLIGNLASTAGNWIQRVAMGWLTWELTESGAWLGVVAFADLFPTFVVGLIAGTIADRYDAMKLLRVTQILLLLQALSLALVVMTGAVTIWWLVVFALLRGIFVSFNRPPRFTVIYHIAGREQLPTAISVNSMVFNSSRFIGPALGGAITAAWGVGWAFAANAFSYALFLTALMMIRIPSTRVEGKKRTGLFRETADGVRYAFGHTGIAFLVILITLESLFVRPFTELLPGFADEVFGRGVHGFSTLLSLHGIGAVVGGYFLAQRGGVTGIVRIVVWALVGLAVSLLVFTSTANYWVALVVMFITGMCFVTLGVGLQTLLQTATAPDMRGRVMGLYGVVARGAPALGALIMGGLSEYFGLPAPVAGGAILCLILWVWARRHQARMADMLERDPATVPQSSDAGSKGGPAPENPGGAGPASPSGGGLSRKS